LRTLRTVGVRGLSRERRLASPCNWGVKDPHGFVERRLRLVILPPGVKLPPKIAGSAKNNHQQRDGSQASVGEHRLGTMLESLPHLVLLQFLTRNVFRHVRSPA